METLIKEKVQVKVEGGEKKKERGDKGLKRLKKRDEVLLGWIAEQYAIRLDQLQILIAMKSENPKRVNPNMVTDKSAMQTVNRWRELGLVEYRKIMFGTENPGWVWLTLQGLRDFGYQYTYREPTISQLNHYYWVNHVRLSLENKYGEDMKWTGERFLRFWGGGKLEHYPDAEVVIRNTRVAIEVELTQKTIDRHKKIFDLLDFKTDEKGGNYYKEIWYYTSESTQKPVEKLAENRNRFRSKRLSEVSVYG